MKELFTEEQLEQHSATKTWI